MNSRHFLTFKPVEVAAMATAAAWLFRIALDLSHKFNVPFFGF